MKELNSPITGKPMRLLYEPDTVEYRGEEFSFVYLSYRDDESGENFTSSESDGIWFNQVTNQYREKHGIPYVDEIIALREMYGLSAAKMSTILGFGANQYRLYEEGEVPSESNGKMIRSAMNPKVFLELVKSSRHQLTEREFAKISTRVEEVIASSGVRDDEHWAAGRLFRSGRGLTNGFAPTSLSRLKNLLLYVLEQMGETFQTKMNKVLFYIDFLSYRERGIAISGLAYQSLEFGPAPQRWDRVYSAFDEVQEQLRLVQGQECMSLKAYATADMSKFTAEEMTVIDEVCGKLKDMTSREVSRLSHEEPAWKGYVGKPGTIPFCEAFTLKAL